MEFTHSLVRPGAPEFGAGARRTTIGATVLPGNSFASVRLSGWLRLVVRRHERLERLSVFDRYLPPRVGVLTLRLDADPGRSVWICPGNPRRSNGNNLFHYCLNQNVNGTGAGNTARRLSSLPHPARTVWLFDSKNLPAVGSWTYVHTNLHGAGAQFTFLDGHAQRFSVNAYWDLAANKARTNNSELLWLPD